MKYKGDAKDAYNFYRARVVEIMGSRNIEKKFPDGSPVEQVLTEGVDKNGYKINFRNFSTEGEENYPTIDLYNTNSKSKYEIKFEEWNYGSNLWCFYRRWWGKI